MKTSNVDKLVQAKMVELADLTDKEQELINSLSEGEIEAIIHAGTKFLHRVALGERALRVVF